MAATPAPAQATALAQAHIEAERRLRLIAARAIANAWQALGSYDEPDVARFLQIALPLVEAAQRQSVNLTTAYLARAIDRPAVGLDIAALIAGLRGGTAPSVVYRRPFVTVWSALADHKPYPDAVRTGMARATAAVETDVQLAMTHTLREVGSRESLILGYRRVPDATACEFCRLIAGRRYLTEDLQPVHAHCGCGVDVITDANRGDFTGNAENDLAIEGVAVRQHGELGPVLVSPDHAFTGPDDLP